MSARAQLVARLERALATLPALTREIFLAHRLDMLGYEEIAARTGLKVAQIEQHIAIGIAHMDRDLTALEWTINQ